MIDTADGRFFFHIRLDRIGNYPRLIRLKFSRGHSSICEVSIFEWEKREQDFFSLIGFVDEPRR